MPHPRIELSVFRISGLDAQAVRQIGEEVAKQREKQLVGHGGLKVKDVQAPLSVQPKEPPPRHADVVGWPALSGNTKEDKSRQKLLAQQLVEKAEFILV